MLNDKSLWGKTCEIFPNTFLSVIGIIWYVPYYRGIYYHRSYIIPAFFEIAKYLVYSIVYEYLNDIILILILFGRIQTFFSKPSISMYRTQVPKGP